MPLTKEELQERAQLLRALDSAVQLEHPTEEQIRFTTATMRLIAVRFGYREVKNLAIDAAPTPRARA